MGHIRTGPLPATRKWDQVVRLIAGGASASQMATGVTAAAEQGLKAADDPGVFDLLAGDSAAVDAGEQQQTRRATIDRSSRQQSEGV